MIIIQLAMHFFQKSSLNTDIQKKYTIFPFLVKYSSPSSNTKRKSFSCLSLNSLFTSFIYLFLAALGLCCGALALLCCTSNLSPVVSRGCSLVVVPHALAAVASPVAEYGRSALRLQQLQRVGQQLKPTGLAAPWHMGSQSRD